MVICQALWKSQSVRQLLCTRCHWDRVITTYVIVNDPLEQNLYVTFYEKCASGTESLWHLLWTMWHWENHFDTCYGQGGTGRVIMTLVMDNMPLGQSHYDTCYGQCATKTESLWHLLWTMCHWYRVIMTPVMDNVPVGQSHYDTCYGQCPTGKSLCHFF